MVIVNKAFFVVAFSILLTI